MPRGHARTQDAIEVIRNMRQAQVGPGRIAQLTGVPGRTIRRILKNDNDTSEGPQRVLQRKGRKPTLDEGDILVHSGVLFILLCS